MEPHRLTGSFSKRISAANSNNIVTILDLNEVNSRYQIFESDYLIGFQSVLEDLKVTVNLPSLSQASFPEIGPLSSESEKQAELAKVQSESQKIGLGLYTAIGNGPWQYESEVVLLNQGSETYVPILVPFLSMNETLLLDGEAKIGIRIEPKWNHPLKNNDFLILKGTYRQVVSFSKKNEDFSELAARIASLELALEGRLINLPANSLLGRGAGTGTVERIDRATFVDTSTDQVIGGSKSFRSDTGTGWSRLISSNSAIGAAFIGSFVNICGVFAHSFNLGAWRDLWLNSVALNQGGSVICGTNLSIGTTDASKRLNVGGDAGITGFTTLGDNVAIKLKRVTGTTSTSQGGVVSFPHGLTGDKIVGVISKIAHDAQAGLGSDFDTYGPGYAYDCWHDSNNVNVQNSPSSSQLVLGKPISVLLFYIA